MTIDNSTNIPLLADIASDHSPKQRVDSTTAQRQKIPDLLQE